MEVKTYATLLGILEQAGLTKNNVPDFDKIAQITGHSRDSLKVFLAPNADTPRWVKLINYIGEKLHTPKLSTDELIEHFNSYCDPFGEIAPKDISKFYLS